VVLTAVGQNGYALRYASKALHDDFKISVAACRQNGISLHYVSEKMQVRGEPRRTAAAAHLAPSHHNFWHTLILTLF